MSQQRARRAANRLRWIARGIGTLVAVLWGFIFVASVIGGEDEEPLLGAILTGLVLIAVVGVGIAWWRAGIGGTIVTIGAVALGVFAYVTAGYNKGLAVLTAGGPFLVSGILFLASWWLSRPTQAPPENAS